MTSNKKSRIFVQMEDLEAEQLVEQLEKVIGYEQPSDMKLIKDLHFLIKSQL